MEQHHKSFENKILRIIYGSVYTTTNGDVGTEEETKRFKNWQKFQG